mmetsp:Transcript_39222/g.57281  ORF Transcript_39222/g.57281 Transcript_39222/m.57281 type:complete len:383 (+) Transcript_39222:230-1378(+)
MKFTSFRTVIGAAFLSSAVVANTPDLCTTDIEGLRQLRPSECDPTGRVGPDIQVGSTIYNNDEAHFVIGSPRVGGKKREGFNGSINVYLPGTTDWPALSSCLLQAVASNGVPTIGLTYGYLSRGDGFRNTRCASLPSTDDVVECLTEQHNDAIYGGTYGADRTYNDAEFWKPVDARDSIAGRLGLLLAELDSLYPDEGWDRFYKAGGAYPDSLPMPKWGKITFSGHSQGAGHAAYLAATRLVHGAVLISGPQDECEGCPEGTKFWIDDTFLSTKITAFAHGDSTETFLEPTLPLMKDNWSRMGTWPAPLQVQNVDSYINYDVCKAPIVSSLEPSSTSPCGRKGHCATALDDSSPVLSNTAGDNVYIYGIDVWANVANVDQCY